MEQRSQDSRARLVTGLVSDRRKIAYVGPVGAQAELWTVNADGSGAVRVLGGVSLEANRVGAVNLLPLAGQTGRKKSPERAAGDSPFIAGHQGAGVEILQVGRSDVPVMASIFSG